MLLPRLMSDIINNTLQSLYVFTGEDRTIMDVYLQQITERYDYQYTYCESVTEVIKINRHKSLLGKQSRKLLVVRDDRSFLTAEEAWGWLSEGSNNLVILIYGVIDARLKFNAMFEHNIVLFDAMTIETLVKHINNTSGLTPNRATIIAEYSNRNYGQALLEMDKVTNYAEAKKVSVDDSFALLYNKNMVAVGETFSVRDYISALFNRNGLEAFENIKEEEALKYLAGVYSHARALYLIKMYAGRSDISEQSGLTSGQIYFYKKNAGVFGIKNLLKIMTIVQTFESGIKRGIIPGEHALSYATAKILNL